jgi:RNA polymerase sigma factor (sigma-70 family)
MHDGHQQLGACEAPAAPLSAAAIDALILAHLPWARRVARRVHRRLALYTEPDECVAVGLLALVKAARRFDPARGTPFEAYAQAWIVGAVRTLARARYLSTDTERAQAKAGRAPLPVRTTVEFDETYTGAAPAEDLADQRPRLLDTLLARAVLTARQRQALEDQRNGLSVAQSAAAMGLTERQVSEARQAGLQACRQAADDVGTGRRRGRLGAA